jgi:hypothetical protein
MSRDAIREKDILHLGHLKRVFSLLDALHDVGCERDKPGNRELHFDQYVKLFLLYVWNPLIGSIRQLQEAAALPKVAKALGVSRFSAGSFSESVNVFDPERLKPIVAELASRLQPGKKDPKLAELKQVLTLVDGTILSALTRMARKAFMDDPLAARFTTGREGKGRYGFRLHTQLDLETFHPRRIDRTGARNGGESRESSVLAAHLEAGRCYVGDCTYSDRELTDQIVAAGSSYVMRGPENSVFEVLEERLLTQADLDAGIVRDALIRFSGEGSPELAHTVRRIEVQVAPHERRSRAGKKQVDLIPVHTCLLDLPAELVALIYKRRYTVEFFFRIFKQLLGMKHLLSQRENGIDIQVQCTLIVCLLLQLITGKKPDKRMRTVIGFYLLGLCDERHVIDRLNRPDNTGIKLRAKDELWKKLGV